MRKSKLKTLELDLKRFIYAPYLTGEELDLLENLETASLDHEITLLRVRISRLLALENASLEAQKENSLDDPALVLEEVAETDSDQFGRTVHQVRRRKQVDGLLMAYTQRLAYLEKTRAEIKNGGGLDTESTAQRVVAAIAAIENMQAAERENASA